MFNIPKKLDIPNSSLIEIFRDIAGKNKDEKAVFFKGKFKTYGELEEEVNKFANSLKKLGVKKGDRVAVIFPNCPQFVTVFFAVNSLGAIFTAFNPMYTAREIKHRLNDCEPKVLIVLDLFNNKINSIRDEIKVEHVITSSVSDELPAALKFLYKLSKLGKIEQIDDGISYKELLINGDNKKINTVINSNEDIAVIQYTGGTTGVPKGAMLTHKNLVSQATIIQFWKTGLKVQPEGQFKVAGVLPFSHIFGLTSSFIWPISEGGTIYLVPDPRKLEEIMKIIDKYGIHFLNCVPILFQKLATHNNIDKYDLSSIHLCISGGESLPGDTVKIFEGKTNCLLIEGYGLTEASPVTHVNPPNKEGRKIGSIGVNVPNTISKIVDAENEKEITNLSKTGELWVKGPGVMKGYWKNKKETENTLKNGWLRTGDIASKDKNGYYQIIDRLKDMIIVSGFKVWPNEVEEILQSHPSIKEAAVIPHITDIGTKIKAVLVLNSGFSEITLDEIKSFCKDSLAPYKIPKMVEYTNELPRSSVGKLLRRKLKENAQ
jgi:long-chain acyl-CoA synthetase